MSFSRWQKLMAARMPRAVSPPTRPARIAGAESFKRDSAGMVGRLLDPIYRLPRISGIGGRKNAAHRSSGKMPTVSRMEMVWTRPPYGLALQRAKIGGVELIHLKR